MFADGPGEGDKGLLALGERTMLARVVEVMARQVDTLALNANGDPARFDSLGLPVIADSIEGFVGPLAGIHAGLRWAVANVRRATHVVTISTDTPFFPDDLVARLSAGLDEAGDDKRIALARSAGQLHPVIGLWPVALAGDLEQALRGGARKVQEWAGRHGAIEVDFPARLIGGRRIDPFFNANSPQDLAEARRLMAELEAG